MEPTATREAIEPDIPRNLSFWSGDRNGTRDRNYRLRHLWTIVISLNPLYMSRIRFQFSADSYVIHPLFSKLRARNNRGITEYEVRECRDISFVNNNSCILRDLRVQNILRIQYWISITHFRTSLNWPSTRFYLSRSIRLQLPFPYPYIADLLKYSVNQDSFDAHMCEASRVWNGLQFRMIILFSR